jgi:glyoxylase-like metal-dependent hydrolase (beta-lactamase superfamily II)
MQRGRVEILFGEGGGKYPDGNTVHVHGTETSVLIDAALSIANAETPPPIDQILLTHCHEDHLPGVSRYPSTPVAAHERDVAALHSLDGLLAIYGLPAEAAAAFAPALVDTYHYRPRPDAAAFADGTCWDVGGSTITAIHTPGHTGGHTCFLVEPEGVLVLGDIDLTGFGPYYGDAASDLDEFVASLAKVREIDAAWYVTYHHKGVFTERSEFVAALDAFAAVIDRREAAMVEFLREPRTLGDMVRHRFVYRAHVELPWLDSCERYTAIDHLARLQRQGAVTEITPGLYQACP